MVAGFLLPDRRWLLQRGFWLAVRSMAIAALKYDLARDVRVAGLVVVVFPAAVT